MDLPFPGTIVVCTFNCYRPSVKLQPLLPLAEVILISEPKNYNNLPLCNSVHKEEDLDDIFRGSGKEQ
jgi:hypothetical protein